MKALDELTALLSPQQLSTDPGDLLARSHDQSPRTLIKHRGGRPGAMVECVVRPSTPEEVAAVLEWAERTNTVVAIVGGRSGVCEGIAPDGGIALDLSGLDQIEGVDESSHLVTAQAGVTGPQLTGYLDERGFFLGHQPQSLAISTVGGWLATRACGQLSARFGGIENVVAGLEAVLVGGHIVRWKSAPRRATGPDLASLIIGSEGTLAVITQATLRVSKIPVERADRCLTFESMASGVQACRLVAQSDLRPTVVRLYDREDTALFMRHEETPVEGPLLLISFDGPFAELRADAALDLCEGTPQQERLVSHWWRHRNDAVDEYRRLMAGEGLLGPHAVIDTMEVAARWGSLRALYHSIKDTLSNLAEFVGCHLSHVYEDGACLYFTMGSSCESDDEALDMNARWWDAGMRATLDAGGTISHHHGVGRLKSPWLEEELDGGMEVLRAVKKALDPTRILNPGVLGL